MSQILLPSLGISPFKKKTEGTWSVLTSERPGNINQ